MMKEVKDTLTYVDISDNDINSIENNAFNGMADKAFTDSSNLAYFLHH